MVLLVLALVLGVADAPRVRVLFLGDRGHHEPRAHDASAALARAGIDVTYTEDLADLRAEILRGFDALLVYANVDSIPKANETALLEFVASGHGLVPVHCVSYCFRDSEAYVGFVGGQFQSHTTGVFRTELVDYDHPITRAYLPFESWDETYVHTQLAANRHVLEVRVDGRGREPYTWTREQGQGRVFYTAWGHDERTWQHAGFHDLLARGIRGSAGDRCVAPPRPLPKLATEAA